MNVKKGDECDDEISDLNGCIRGKVSKKSEEGINRLNRLIC